MSWQFKEGNTASNLANRLKNAVAKGNVIEVPAYVEEAGFMGGAKKKTASKAAASWLASHSDMKYFKLHGSVFRVKKNQNRSRKDFAWVKAGDAARKQ